MKKMFFLFIAASLYICSYSQNRQVESQPLKIVVDINKNHFYLGDSLCIKIKNVDEKNRSIGVEAFLIRTDSSAIEYSDYYTAYFNSDSNWFKKNQPRKKKRSAESTKIQTSDPEIKYFNIAPNEEHVYWFLINGEPAIIPSQIQLNFITDFVEGEDDFKLLSKKLYLHAQYN